MEDHYVYLTSLANSIEYPENTIASFTNRMNPPLLLKGSWSVGLVNCFFNTEFVAIQKNDEMFKLNLSIAYLDAKNNVIAYEKFVYRPTRNIHGKQVRGILQAVEADLRNYLIGLKVISKNSGEIFAYGEGYKYVVINKLELENPTKYKFSKIHGSWTCQKGLAALLGIEPCTPKNFSNLSSYIGRLTPRLINVSNVFIYTDIVKGSHVGDSESDILDVLAIGDTFSKNSQFIIYKHVKQEFIESISILLKDQNGQKLKFRDGNSSTCILHFKKV